MKFKKLITLASLVGLIVFLATTVVACTSKSEKTDTKTEQTSSQKDKDKDKELKEYNFKTKYSFHFCKKINNIKIVEGVKWG